MSGTSSPRKPSDKELGSSPMFNPFGVDLEPMSNESGFIDYEMVLFQALVNEGKHTKVFNAKRPSFHLNEKQLREAAAAEVAKQCALEEDNDKSKKKKNLNPDERAKQNRDRNREHAKNTRLRKKAYILKLKELVDRMAQQKEKEERERRALGVRIHDTNVLRKNAVRLFLSYRAANLRDREKWGSILDESFVLTLPITPYRSFRRSDIVSSYQVLVGIDTAITDANSLALMVESIGQDSLLWKESIKRGQSCRIVYSTSAEHMFSAGDTVMCRFVMRTAGYEAMGALGGCVQHGMLYARFNDANKIVAAEMVFDVMAFMQQLQRASALSPEASIIPNTINMALQPSREARVITKSHAPLSVIHINEAWTEKTSVTQSEAEGLPLGQVMSIMSSQEDQLNALATNCLAGRAGSALLLTHCRVAPGKVALVYLKMLPLISYSNAVTHILAVHTDIPLSAAEKSALQLHCRDEGINGVGVEGSSSGSQGSQKYKTAPSSSSSISSNTTNTTDIAAIGTYNNSALPFEERPRKQMRLSNEERILAPIPGP